MNKNVFREYDIRGVVEKDFSNTFVFDLGRAFGTFLKNQNHNKISISGDIRHSTKKLKNILIEGLLEVGVDVYDMGVLPTPVNYFSLYNTDIVNSIQITGSHNPKEYNGFKISFNKKPFFGKQIIQLYDIIIKKSFFNSLEKGQIILMDVLDDYIKMIKSDINIVNDIKCVMDCGNSVGSIVAPNLFKELGITTKEMFCNVDADFPNHHPDPTVDDNLKFLIKEIKSDTYDLGVAYDGDADRVVAVDENGNIIRADILMTIFLSEIISKGDTVVYDVKCSRVLEHVIKKYKGIPLMYKTGHSLIKNKMIETASKFGGEMSGHIFFADRYFGYDDGIYVSLRLIELLSKKTESISNLLLDLPKYVSTPEIRIDCEEDNQKFNIVRNVKEYFIDKYDCNLIDGIRIEFPFGWGLIRNSNTQPVIVCRFEADTEENLIKIQELIFEKINHYGGNII